MTLYLQNYLKVPMTIPVPGMLKALLMLSNTKPDVKKYKRTILFTRTIPNLKSNISVAVNYDHN